MFKRVVLVVLGMVLFAGSAACGGSGGETNGASPAPPTENDSPPSATEQTLRLDSVDFSSPVANDEAQWAWGSIVVLHSSVDTSQRTLVFVDADGEPITWDKLTINGEDVVIGRVTPKDEYSDLIPPEEFFGNSNVSAVDFVNPNGEKVATLEVPSGGEYSYTLTDGALNIEV
ncbi:MAG: hypothetical protein FWG16_08100 [Micrococcales bacterium]|nr:hypothetical protein [Micrococcales bacterium]